MAIQPINLGNYANDGTGDDLRTAFTKVNANFTELYNGAAISTAINGVAGNMVLYADPIFQYGSTNKISTAITLVPLTKTFTAV